MDDESAGDNAEGGELEDGEGDATDEAAAAAAATTLASTTIGATLAASARFLVHAGSGASTMSAGVEVTAMTGGSDVDDEVASDIGWLDSPTTGEE